MAQLRANYATRFEIGKKSANFFIGVRSTVTVKRSLHAQISEIIGYFVKIRFEHASVT